MSARRTRVVQWATGNIGTRALREVIRHPGLELAGVLVYDPAKNGVDAGVLCGEGPVGVAATDDPAAIRKLEADCVLYMPRSFDIDDVVALLESGTNIVTTRGEVFGSAHRLGDAARARIVDACTRGGSSIYATGSSPGFITETLPYALLSMQRHVESIEIDEFANLSQRDSPHLLFEQMGFGKPLDSYNPNRAAYLVGEFSPSLALLAEAAGRPVDEWAGTGEVAAARRTTSLAAGELAAGSVAAQRTIVAGRSGGVDVVRFTANWYCTTDVEPAWELRPTGWRVRVRGDAPFDVDLPFPVPLEDLGSFTPAYTANRPVNAIPYVCAAPPGILCTTDLAPITPAGPARVRRRATLTSVGMTSVAIVTGAGSGIGAACARRLASTVDVLLLADVNEAAVTASATACAGEGADCRPVVVDVTDPVAVQDLVARAEASGTLRRVAHVAGISPTMGDWRRILDVDLVATARLIDALLPLAGAGTAVVCVASMAAYLNAQANAAADAAIDDPLAAGVFDAFAAAVGEPEPDPGITYAWAKRGVQRIVRRQALAFGAVGARICSVSPGTIDTPMGRQEFAQQPMMKVLEDMTPLRRKGRADELAAVVTFLLSDEASFMTGVDVLVDGGACAAVGVLG